MPNLGSSTAAAIDIAKTPLVDYLPWKVPEDRAEIYGFLTGSP
jgi:hypothetical protein